MMLVTTAWLIAIGAVLFQAASDWGWPQGWIFLTELGGSTFAVNFWLQRHDPALLATRLTAPVHRDQRPWDRIFMALALIAFIGWLILCAVDARRLRWSLVPEWLQCFGAASIAACMLVVWRTFRVNTFAAPQVRVQADRQQRVINSGPYQFVRHPMYAGSLLMFIGTPLLLGSWWGLLLVPLAAVGIGMRAIGEERMLRRELPGYDDYAAQVPYRMIPGVW